MKPISLQLKDFMNHGETFIDFSLFNVAAIVGIEEGSEKNSVATGKTNIFNAIKYALFNSKIGVAKERVIRDGASKCEVRFVFEAPDGSVYKIDRARSKSAQYVKFYLQHGNNEWIDKSGKTSTQTDEEIFKIISINEETFENSSYLKQNDYKRRKIDVLASATPADRKAIIIDMLMLGIWGKFEKKAKDLRDKNNVELSNEKGIISNIIEPEKQIVVLQARIDELSKIIIDAKKDVETAFSLMSAKQVEVDNAKNSLSKDYPDLKKKLDAEMYDYAKLSNEMASLQSQQTRRKKELKEINHSVELNKKSLLTQENVLSLIKNSDDILFPKPVETDYNKVLDEISKIKNSIRENKSSLSALSKPIPDDEICPECGTELNEDYRAELENKKTNKIDLLKKAVEKDNIALNKFLLDKAALDKSISEYNAHVDKINKINAEITDYKKAISNAENDAAQKQKSIDALIEDIKAKNASMNSCGENVVNLKEKIEKIDNKAAEELINRLSNEFAALTKNMQKKNEILYNLSGEMAKCELSLKLKNDELKLLNEREVIIKSLERRALVYKAAMSCFGKNGIQAMIITSVLDALQVETNKFLEMLFPSLQLQFIINKTRDDGTQEDTLEIMYYIAGAERDFQELSGGQQACVVLAMKLATALISRQRCGSNVKMLLLDEIDQALDEACVDAFCDIIKKLSKEMTMLIITHNKNLQAKFHSFIIVRKENGVSHAEVQIDA